MDGSVLQDHEHGFGLITRGLHWLLALAILALFALGYWMVTLDYTSVYYNSAPAWHEAVGMVVFFLMMVRIGWRHSNRDPDASYLSMFERRTSKLMHWTLYLVIVGVLISGYLISTSDGRGIELFFGLEVPSLVQSPGLATPAGTVHRYLSYLTLILAGIHTGAALKHHFVDRDPTLARMWRGERH